MELLYSNLHEVFSERATLNGGVRPSTEHIRKM